jgi:hypothetical protein
MSEASAVLKCFSSLHKYFSKERNYGKLRRIKIFATMMLANRNARAVINPAFKRLFSYSLEGKTAVITG